eukprot:1161847-Pelagomonas_calceolata.AAC.3
MPISPWSPQALVAATATYHRQVDDLQVIWGDDKVRVLHRTLVLVPPEERKARQADKQHRSNHHHHHNNEGLLCMYARTRTQNFAKYKRT